MGALDERINRISPEMAAFKLRVHDLWTVDGFSAGEIAQDYETGRLAMKAGIFELTRNVVIGHVHRMKLPPRDDIPRHRRGGCKTARAPTKKPTPPPEPVENITPLNLDMMALTRKTCRWPYGEGPFTFCGLPVAAGGQIYCGAHWHIAHPKQPAPGHAKGSVRADKQFGT